MNKLKIRITKFDTLSKKGRFFHDTEETVFLHEIDEDIFFDILNAIGKITENIHDKEIRSIKALKD